MKIDKDILIFLIINIVILVSGGIIIYELLSDRINECIANPLVFGAKQVEKDYGFEKVSCSCNSLDKIFAFNTTTMYVPRIDVIDNPIEKPNYTEFFDNIIIKK